MEMQHFLHQQHPLKLVRVGEDDGQTAGAGREKTCARCLASLWGQVYACAPCRFYLHEVCANLPQKLEHPFHPCPLFLQFVPIPGVQGGKGQVLEPFYRCEACNFGMDPRSAQIQPIRSGEEGIQHFTHPEHPLNLSYEETDAELYCWGCWKSISGKSYACHSCAYYLHETCVAPLKIQHFFHPCPLLLVKVYGEHSCDACFKECSNVFMYHCRKCKFTLHMECSKFQPINSEEEGILHSSHHHPLILSYTDAEHRCNGCQQRISGEIYACQSCGFHLDKHCAKLPPELQHISHPCPLFLKPTPEATCDACSKGCSDMIVYHCQNCNISMHVQCAMIDHIILDQHEKSAIFRPIDFEEGIMHFSHPHSLKRYENANAKLQCCECRLPISRKSFACHSCGLYVHETCYKLPCKIKHFFHPCTLFRQFKRNSRCDACTKYHDPYVFVYHCQECNFQMCTECVMFSATGSDGIQHWSHLHPLQLFEAQGEESGLSCMICHSEIPGQTDYASCEYCSFYIHKPCMSLPQEIQHLCHPCPLSLTGPRQFCCNTCSYEGSKPASYQCKKCDFNMHVTCALFSQEIVQDDDSKYIHHFCHHHPLQLFKDGEKVTSFFRRDPQCQICGILAPGLTYRCKRCGLFLHKSCLDVLPQIISIGDGSLVFVTSRKQNICNKCGENSYFHFLEVNSRTSHKWCIPCALEEVLSIRVSPSTIVIQLHFHPCPLTLKLFPSFTCNACFTYCHTHAYYCDQCDFYVGMKCAQISRQSSKGEEEMVQHFCHWHPLQQLQHMEVSTILCNICGRLCLDLSYFCKKCNFYIHKSCLEILSIKIDNHYFNCTLVLLRTLSYKCVACQEENNVGLAFRSIERGFKLCIKCVIWPKNKWNEDGTFISIHHWHKLVLATKLEKDANCLLCRGNGSSLMYFCGQCEDYFHKACVELPLEFEHPLHQQHSPTTFSRSDKQSCTSKIKKNVQPMSGGPTHYWS